MKQKQHLNSATGFVLIEVLFSCFILVSGLAGLALLLLATMQQSRDAVLQTQALLYAEDMLERVRAHPELARLTVTTFENAPTVAVDCYKNPCRKLQMAAFHVAIWKCFLAGSDSELCPTILAKTAPLAICKTWQLPNYCYSLPEGDGQIVIQDQLYEVTVRWRGAYNADTENGFREVRVSTKI